LELTYDEIIDLIGDKTQTGAIPIKNLSREWRVIYRLWSTTSLGEWVKKIILGYCQRLYSCVKKQTVGFKRW
jgi:hypothetical protein